MHISAIVIPIFMPKFRIEYDPFLPFNQWFENRPIAHIQHTKQYLSIRCLSYFIISQLIPLLCSFDFYFFCLFLSVFKFCIFIVEYWDSLRFLLICFACPFLMHSLNFIFMHEISICDRYRFDYNILLICMCVCVCDYIRSFPLRKDALLRCFA